MRRRSNYAPKSRTIVLAAVLTVFAALVFFTSIVPATIAGFATGTLALYAAIVAFVILLLGTFVDGVFTNPMNRIDAAQELARIQRITSPTLLLIRRSLVQLWCAVAQLRATSRAPRRPHLLIGLAALLSHRAVPRVDRRHERSSSRRFRPPTCAFASHALGTFIATA